MPRKTGARALVALGLSVMLAGCNAGEKGVTGTSPPTPKTLVPRGNTPTGDQGDNAGGLTDPGAGSTTTGGKH